MRERHPNGLAPRDARASGHDALRRGEPHEPDIVADVEIDVSNLRFTNGRIPDQGRVIAHDRQVPFGMQIDQFTGDLDRPVKGERDIRERNRHGFPVDDHQPPISIDDQARPPELLPVDTIEAVGNRRRHHHERGCDPAYGPGRIDREFGFSPDGLCHRRRHR